MGVPILFTLSSKMQKDEIEKYCYVECGKILPDNILNDIFGDLKTCNQRNCSFEVKRMEIGKGICLRRLGIKYYKGVFVNTPI